MSGRQEYREFRPVELYDVAAVESWLEERDREGYHLLRFRGLYGIFYQDCSGHPCAKSEKFRIWRSGRRRSDEISVDQRRGGEENGR